MGKLLTQQPLPRSDVYRLAFRNRFRNPAPPKHPVILCSSESQGSIFPSPLTATTGTPFIASFIAAAALAPRGGRGRPFDSVKKKRKATPSDGRVCVWRKHVCMTDARCHFPIRRVPLSLAGDVPKANDLAFVRPIGTRHRIYEWGREEGNPRIRREVLKCFRFHANNNFKESLHES